MNKEELAALLDPFDQCDLYCDGMSRVLSPVLARKGVPHTTYFGRLINKRSGQEVIHYWIGLQNGLVVDYRARMWLATISIFPTASSGQAIISTCGMSESQSSFTCPQTICVDNGL